jgi:hypothetical protein
MGHNWQESEITCENVNIFVAAEPGPFCPHPFKPWYESVCCDAAPIIEPCNKFYFSNVFDTYHMNVAKLQISIFILQTKSSINHKNCKGRHHRL